MIVFFFFSTLPLKEAAYEEIEVHPPKAGSGTELKTIYITAGFPPHASAESHDHSDANSVTCSTAKEKDQQPTYSTVGHPRAPPEDASNGSTPLYYTVNKHWAKQASVNVHSYILRFNQDVQTTECIASSTHTQGQVGRTWRWVCTVQHRTLESKHLWSIYRLWWEVWPMDIVTKKHSVIDETFNIFVFLQHLWQNDLRCHINVTALFCSSLGTKPDIFVHI